MTDRLNHIREGDPGPVGAGVRARLAAISRDRDTLLLVLLLALHLAPVWAFPYFPTQDGPSHINNANVIWEYHRPEGTTLREYYRLNTRPEPNLVGYVIMAVPLFAVSPLVAEKLFLSLYVLLFPLAVRYVLGGIRPDARFLALFSFPFVYSHSLHMGFYNFSWSLPMFLFVIGYWLRHRDRFGVRQAVVLSLLLVVTYLSHLLSVAMSGLAVGLLVVWFALLDGVRGRRGGGVEWRTVLRSFVVRAQGPLAAAVPALGLTAAYIARQAASPDRPPSPAMPGETLDRLKRLAAFDGLVSFSKAEALLSSSLVLVFAATAAYLLAGKLRGTRPWSRWDGLLLLTAGYVVFYFLTPEEGLGGGIITPRITLYVYLACLLWLGGQGYPAAMRRGLRAAAVAIACLFVGLHWRKYTELESYYREYVSAARFVQPGSTLLALSFSDWGHAPDGRQLSWRVAPFLHAAGYIAAHKDGVVVLNNYEAGYDYFPVVFRASRSPFTHMGEPSRPDESRIDFLRYPRRTGGTVDYVLVWGGRVAPRSNPFVRDVYGQLRAGYRLIYRSPQRGMVELYRSEPAPAPGSPPS